MTNALPSSSPAQISSCAGARRAQRDTRPWANTDRCCLMSCGVVEEEIDDLARSRWWGFTSAMRTQKRNILDACEIDHDGRGIQRRRYSTQDDFLLRHPHHTDETGATPHGRCWTGAWAARRAVAHPASRPARKPIVVVVDTCFLRGGEQHILTVTGGVLPCERYVRRRRSTDERDLRPDLEASLGRVLAGRRGRWKMAVQRSTSIARPMDGRLWVAGDARAATTGRGWTRAGRALKISPHDPHARDRHARATGDRAGARKEAKGVADRSRSVRRRRLFMVLFQEARRGRRHGHWWHRRPACAKRWHR